MRGAGVAASAVVLAMAGCSLITSYAEFDAPQTGATACGHAIPPPPADPNPGGKANELLGVTSDFTFLPAFDAGGPLGYNIDGLCTCPGKPACAPPDGSTGSCDPPGSGIDNAASSLLDYLFRTKTSNDVLDTLHAGKWGMLVDVTEYNGKADDGSVTVAVFNVAALAGGGVARYDDGGDSFIPDGNSLATQAGDGTSKYVTTSAYVTGGVLVAPFSHLEVNILVFDVLTGTFGTRVQIPFTTATLVGKLSSNGNGGLQMAQGQVVGRVANGDMFKQVKRIGGCSSNENGKGILLGTKKNLCSALDITAVDHPGGTTAPCDALSFNMGFDIVPARRTSPPYEKIDPTPGPCPNDPDESCN